MKPDEPMSLAETQYLMRTVSHFVSTVMIIDTYIRHPELSDTEAILRVGIEGIKAIDNMFNDLGSKVPENGPLSPLQFAEVIKAVMKVVDNIRSRKE